MHRHSEEDLDKLRVSHSPEAIRQRLEDGPSHSHLGDFVLGAIDGSITTFAVVAGAVGADLGAGIVVILGLANLLADGFSMGVGVFLSQRAEHQQADALRVAASLHIDIYPDGAREAVRQIFLARGFDGEALDYAVATVTSTRETWLHEIMHEVHDISDEHKSAGKAGLVTFLAFLLVGTIPLLVYFVALATDGDVPSPFLWASILTGGAFFLVGAVKSTFVATKWWYEGLETLAVGGVAASLAYGVGVLLRGLVDSV
ncbi:MAG: VIT1/CCC1 transporter family protein [Chloroflexi bacterium]|nr:VIT1/CCC1 transporter family protein [Chloroflexota bacterium]